MQKQDTFTSNNLTKSPVMIRIILYFTFLILSLFFPYNTTAQESSWGRGCLGGSSICISENQTLETSTERSTFSKKASNQLTISITIDKLSLKEQENIAGKVFSELDTREPLYLIQEEDFIMDYEFLLGLDLDTKMNLLKAGNYPLEIIENEAIITLTLVAPE